MRPTFRCVLWFAAAIPVALLPVFLTPKWLAVWIAWIGAGLLATGLDAILAFAPGRLRVVGRAPRTVYVGSDATLELDLDPAGLNTRAVVEFELDTDPELVAPPRQRAELAGTAVTLLVPLRATRRGTYKVRGVAARWTGPLGLVERRVTRASSLQIAVVPDIRPVRAAALRFFTSRQFYAGSNVEKFLGEGSEFESLREYTRGMDPRAIDWKASARHRKLYADEYRAERDHQLVVSIDVGRLMREPLSGVARVDHAIHAALLLAYVGLRSGDRVGFHAFDDRPRLHLPPVGGVDAFARIQTAAASLRESTAETNFTLGLLDLSTRLRRRSLVVIFTDFVDGVTASLMVDNVAHLVRKHLVLFVALRDPELDRLKDARPSGTLGLYRAVTAGDLVRERSLVLRRLERMGVRVVDAAPGQVAQGVLSAYLDARRRELVG